MTASRASHGSTCPGGCTCTVGAPPSTSSRWERRAQHYRPTLSDNGPGWERPHGHVTDAAGGPPRPMSPAKRRAARAARKGRKGKGRGR